MAETKGPAGSHIGMAGSAGSRSDLGKDVKSGPTVHVRALAPCYINGVYYFAGDEFDIEESGFNDKAMELAPVAKRP